MTETSPTGLHRTAAARMLFPGEPNAARRTDYKLGWCLLCLFICLSRAPAEGVRHFVLFNRDRERIADAAFLGT